MKEIAESTSSTCSDEASLKTEQFNAESARALVHDYNEARCGEVARVLSRVLNRIRETASRGNESLTLTDEPLHHKMLARNLKKLLFVVNIVNDSGHSILEIRW